jgi:parvulin-like peptidyl-prolyl isomerase
VEAARVLEALATGTSFIDAAIAWSTDPSAVRGGRVEAPVSPADPTYPAPILEALPDLEPGTVSDPIPVETGLALVQVVGVTPGRAIPSAQEDALHDQARERLLRWEIAKLRRIVEDEAALRIYDPRLRDAYDAIVRE